MSTEFDPRPVWEARSKYYIILDMKQSHIDVLNDLEFLIEKYSLVRRTMTQPVLFEIVKESNKQYTYNPADPLIQETLIEHVGSLPIVATTLYPYINDDQVDLGKALIMLAVHDIGELETGDENTYIKQESSKPRERDAALSLLNPLYHEFYDDIETQNSQTAKFAKSIDKFAADVLNYLTPAEHTIARFKYYADVEASDIISTMRNHKRPYMLWNTFMTELYEVVLERLEKKLEPVLKG